MDGSEETLHTQVRATIKAMRRLTAGSGALRRGLASDLGISVLELNALALVWETATVTPKQLSVELNLTTGSVTALIDRLESAGFMARVPNPTDRRSVLLHLTPRGNHSMEWVYDQYDVSIAPVMEITAVATPDITEFMDRAAAALLERASTLEKQ